MLLVVNYHIVNLVDSEVNGLTAAEFMRHVHWLSDNFELVNLNDVLSMSRNREMPSRSCLITFDDGLKCQHDVIMPLMKEYGFEAAFFVSASPLVDRVATDIHRFQHLRNKIPSDILIDTVWKILNDIDYVVCREVDEDMAVLHYRYSSPAVAQIKFLINYVLPRNIRHTVVDMLFDELKISDDLFCKDWYLSIEDMIEMDKEFQCIGSHAWTHDSLGTLSTEEASNELGKSKRFLEEELGRSIHALSYPLGNSKAVTKREIELAKKEDYRLAFTMNRAINTNFDNPLMLSRIDCNDLPIGKAPLFKMDKEGLVSIL